MGGGAICHREVGGGGQQRMGADLDSDDLGPRTRVSRNSGEGGRRGRGAAMERAWENDEHASEETTSSDEGSLSEPPPSPARRPRRRAPTAEVGRLNVCPSLKTSAGGKRGGRAPKRHEKLVTLEAITTPDGGVSCAKEGATGRAPKPPAPGPRRAPAGNEAICVSMASDGEPRGGGGSGGWRGGRFVVGARPRQGVGGSNPPPPPSAGYPGEGDQAAYGSCREYALAVDDVCAGGSGGCGGGKRTCRRGRCWSRPECVRGAA